VIVTLPCLPGTVVRESTYDTAGSAKLIAKENMQGAAAICSSMAAGLYGLEVLDEGIEDDR
jgi:prephenate dehydratase